MKPCHFLAVALLLTCVKSSASAQQIAGVAFAPQEDRHLTESVSKLPVTVKPLPDAVSLRADFDHTEKGVVRMYLSNTTDEAISVPAQDGDVYSKRESKGARGKWQRCDGHAFSWCGNSYISINIPPGEFYTWQQRLDSNKGEKQPVRFRLYHQTQWNLVSNHGTAVIDSEEMECCRLDFLGLQEAPFEDVLRIGMQEIKGGQGASIDAVESAIEALGRFGSDPRYFDAVKHLLNYHRTAVQPKTRQEFKSRSERYYESALKLLTRVQPDKSSKDYDAFFKEHAKRHWSLLRSELFEETNPWRTKLLSNLTYNKDFDLDDDAHKRMKALLDEVIAQPDHPAIQVALEVYWKFSDPDKAVSLLAKVADNPKYPSRARTAAHDAWEALFPNPYVSFSFSNEPRDLASDLPGEFTAITVRIINISPKPVTLPEGRAQELCLIRITDSITRAEIPLKPNAKKKSGEAKQITLQPGETYELKNVCWWKLAEPSESPQCENLNVELVLPTPDLWKVPAKSNRGLGGEELGGIVPSWSIKTRQYLEVIKTATSR